MLLTFKEIESLLKCIKCDKISNEDHLIIYDFIYKNLLMCNFDKELIKQR